MSKDMNQFQTIAAELAVEMFPEDEPGQQLADSLIARLCEETGELARALRKLTRKRFGHPGEERGTAQDVVDELGDCLFLLARVAELCQVDLGEAAVLVLMKVNQRINETREAQGDRESA